MCQYVPIVGTYVYLRFFIAVPTYTEFWKIYKLKNPQMLFWVFRTLYIFIIHVLYIILLKFLLTVQFLVYSVVAATNEANNTGQCIATSILPLPFQVLSSVYIFQMAYMHTYIIQYQYTYSNTLSLHYRHPIYNMIL